jgi:hypothetical protein
MIKMNPSMYFVDRTSIYFKILKLISEDVLNKARVLRMELLREMVYYMAEMIQGDTDIWNF